MRKQALLNLFMLLLVAGLAALVLWGPEPNTAQEEISLTSLETDDVERIVIAFHDKPSVSLVRSGGQWFVDNPQRWPADSERVARILALAEMRSHARYPASQIDDAELQLAPPRIVVTLGDTRFEFGGQEALNHYRYVRIGDWVHLVTDTVIHQLSDHPESFADRRVLPRDAQITGLNLPGFSLTRDEKGTWHSEPPAPKLSQDSLNQFIDGWRYARALEVTPASEAPAEAITIQLQNPTRTLRLELIEHQQDLILERRDLGLRYVFDAGQRERLLQLPAQDGRNE